MLIAYIKGQSPGSILLTLHCFKYQNVTAIVKNSSLIKGSATKLKSRTLCDWIFEPFFKIFHFILYIIASYSHIVQEN